MKLDLHSVNALQCTVSNPDPGYEHEIITLLGINLLIHPTPFPPPLTMGQSLRLESISWAAAGIVHW